MIQELQQIRCL